MKRHNIEKNFSELYHETFLYIVNTKRFLFNGDMEHDKNLVQNAIIQYYEKEKDSTDYEDLCRRMYIEHNISIEKIFFQEFKAIMDLIS